MNRRSRLKLRKRQAAEALQQAPQVLLRSKLAEVNAAGRIDYRAQIVLMDALLYLQDENLFRMIKADRYRDWTRWPATRQRAEPCA